MKRALQLAMFVIMGYVASGTTVVAILNHHRQLVVFAVFLHDPDRVVEKLTPQRDVFLLSAAVCSAACNLAH